MLRRTALKILPAATLRLRAGGPETARDIIESAVGARRVAGAIVAVKRRGKTVLEMAAGYANLETGRKMRIDDICMIASSTKPFAASTIMTLVDAGKLSLDDRISRFFPEFKADSTIRQCLSHTSGIFGNDGPAASTQWIRNFDRTLKDAVAGIVREPLVYTPGGKFSYGGASFCVVGRICEMFTGMEFDAYARRVLFDPLGLKDTMYRTARDIAGRVPAIYTRKGEQLEEMKAVMELPGRRGPRPDGFVLVPGGIYSTAHDTLRLLEMHLGEGSFDGKRVLSRDAVLEMRKKQTGKLGAEYGLGWQRYDGERRFGHGGAYGTEIWVDVPRALTGVIFTQMPLAQVRPFIDQVRNAIEREVDLS